MSNNKHSLSEKITKEEAILRVINLASTLSYSGNSLKIKKDLTIKFIPAFYTILLQLDDIALFDLFSYDTNENRIQFDLLQFSNAFYNSYKKNDQAIGVLDRITDWALTRKVPFIKRKKG